ncbi:YdeI/OmpD-associated family protein [Hymenobacter sp. BT635]|uniref:YdeI/OmpD-associated family protein n=1 Tax=Hymenobacter nitidus TaxID=2880929 RepID=A0ABS8A7X6_9BACT|nr:YdeI/OmpD-associated family protein [Hymenobacter nitidus]MCB2376411.1 YdeI/OmpD-associated family protein [Hymenobacter nitidus]
MSDSAPTATFTALLEPGGPSFMPTQIVIVPQDVVASLGGSATRRVVGTLNGFPIRLGLLPLNSGERYLMVNKDTCKAAGLRLGQQLTVCLTPDPTPDAVDLPTELAEGLAEWPEAAAGFQRLTGGMKRAIAYHINTAKRPETRLNRTMQVLRQLATGGHPFRAPKD